MKRSSIVVLIVGLLVIGAASIAGVIWMVGRYRQPLAEPLVLQATEIEASPTPRPTGAPAPQPSPTPVEETCGQSGRLAVLVTGANNAVDSYYPRGAGLIRYIVFDFDGEKITVIAIPHDLVMSPAEAGRAGERRLMLIYRDAIDAAQGTDRERMTGATEGIAQALYDNFALRPDHYLTLHLDQIPAMVDTLGGVEIDNKEDFTTHTGVHFALGVQALDGGLVAEYVREYTGEHEYRLERQVLVARALFARLVTLDGLARVPELYAQFQEALVTDLSPEQIRSLVCLAGQVPSEGVVYHAIDSSLYTEEQEHLFIPRTNEIIAKLAEWLRE